MKKIQIKIYDWPGNSLPKSCTLCCKPASKTIYNNSKIGSLLPGWYACHRKKCYVLITLKVLKNICPPKSKGKNYYD